MASEAQKPLAKWNFYKSVASWLLLVLSPGTSFNVNIYNIL